MAEWEDLSPPSESSLIPFHSNLARMQVLLDAILARVEMFKDQNAHYRELFEVAAGAITPLQETLGDLLGSSMAGRISPADWPVLAEALDSYMVDIEKVKRSADAAFNYVPGTDNLNHGLMISTQRATIKPDELFKWWTEGMNRHDLLFYDYQPRWSESRMKLYRKCEDEHLNYENELRGKGGGWSGKREQFDVAYERLTPDVQRQLASEKALGTGRFGQVSKVLCHKIPMAKKSIWLSSAVHSEVKAARRLDRHHHIIKLVGSFVTNTHGIEMLHVLSFPVAHCDLDKFLREYETLCPKVLAKEGITRQWFSQMEEMLKATGLWISKDEILYPARPLVIKHVRRFLQQSMGCISSAIKFMHTMKISHDDLKPANILLHNHRLYITDFGLSRDRREAENSTESYPGSTRGWTAPEKGQMQKHDPFKADVYSLGCIFMHLATILFDFDDSTTAACFSILQSDPVRREQAIHDHFAAFRPISLPESQESDHPTYRPSELVRLTMRMLENDRKLRPAIDEVNHRLLQLGSCGASKFFHGRCCWN